MGLPLRLTMQSLFRIHTLSTPNLARGSTMVLPRFEMFGSQGRQEARPAFHLLQLFVISL